MPKTIDSKAQIYNILSVMTRSFVNTEHLSSIEFLQKAFDAAFLLIPEAEKGSLFFENYRLIHSCLC